jgi:non-lysosomal glucosylceramidase
LILPAGDSNRFKMRHALYNEFVTVQARGILLKPTPGIRVFDSSASVLAFPLGGIGTGNVSLGARGDLRDWEIFGTAAKGTLLPNTFFSLRLQMGDDQPVMRVLEGPIQPPYTLSHGYHPATTAGLPRLQGTTFRGEYPFAQIDFEAPDLPVRISLEAFTPLVPLDPADSGLPCAVLTWTLTNTTDLPVDMTLVGSLANPAGGVRYDSYGNIAALTRGQSVSSFRDEGDWRGLFMAATGLEEGDLLDGSISLTSDHDRVTVKPAWLRAGWYDYLRDFWNDLEDGQLTDLGYDTPNDLPETGSLGLLDRLAPGASQTYRFVLAWHFPNRVNSWDAASPRRARARYAGRFADAWDVAGYLHDNLSRLARVTGQFHAALFGSTLPPVVLDAVSANIVAVRSTTCFWLEDGRFFGWEGCFDEGGCCAGTCTHVWSYAQTVAYLFPSLEREMRRMEFTSSVEDSGWMSFRNYATFDEFYVWPWGDQKPEAAVDGQMGSVLRVYREWLLSGNRDWLRGIWPGVKRAMAFAPVQWDTDGDGVLDGRQHNTYDIEFYGPNPLSMIYYLAALRATEALAAAMDEPDLAARARGAFERGSVRFDELCWDGEYYIQRIADVDAHKYQHGEGCLSDQLLGQLQARILGLGDLLPPEKVRAAIKAVYAHNFRRSLVGHANAQRTYALNDEPGLLLCTWPDAANQHRPRFPFVYSDEVWTGIEYQVAAHLIYEGWLVEGLEIVAAARGRHDGIRRNPWDEVECGHHYSRAMSSWALLLALSGFQCDVDGKRMRFAPVTDASTEPSVFRSFWSCGLAWGTYEQRHDAESGAWIHGIEVLGNAPGIDPATLTVVVNGTTMSLRLGR